MNSIYGKAYPRATLIGDPSDNYTGKSIAFVFRNFQAEASITASDRLELVPGERDDLEFRSLSQLSAEIGKNGYYGGIRLMKASLKRFHDYFHEEGIPLPRQNFRLSYHSNIPNGLGLAGSSAIITAIFRALISFFKLEMTPGSLAALVLSVENKELGISTGLPTRIAQAFNKPVFMDFSDGLSDSEDKGHFQPFPANWLPPLFLAYDQKAAFREVSYQNGFLGKFEKDAGEAELAIQAFADMANEAHTALKMGQNSKIGPLVNSNFKLRKSIMTMNPQDVALVEMAQECGGSAKLAGSGGAIIGTFPREAVYDRLKNEFGKAGIEVIRPEIVG